jgi:3-oxoacyl-[acyl-carrier-protein] synthase III
MVKNIAIELAGFGKYVAQRRESNAEVAERLGVSEKNIYAKTGVLQRYISDDESASTMAIKAISEALDDAMIDADELQGVIVATFSGDYLYPNVASKICKELGITSCFAFDLQANCAGFQMGMAQARDRLSANPDSGPVAVVGVARQHPYLDPYDENTAYYFSDAASATIMKHSNATGGLQESSFKTNGKSFEIVRLRGGGSSFPLSGDITTHDPKAMFYEHAGLGVWKEVMVEMPILIRKTIEQAGWQLTDIDLVLFHQANLRLIEFLMSRLRLPLEQTVTNIAEIGNTADASLGTVLFDAARQGRLVPGTKVLLASVGAGFVYVATPYIVPERVG